MAIKHSIFGCIMLMMMIRVSEAHKKIYRPASGLYVFGDSAVDVGNNNPFHTYIKSDYPPYGVDFPAGTNNGRPTNGFNMADFYAQWLGFDLPPAARLVDKNSTNIFHGMNFASSGAGVFPKTGTKMFAKIISLGQQVDMFERFKRTMLPERYQTQATLNAHISKSIFLVVIGVNDISTIISIKNNTDPRAYVKNIDDIIWRLGGRLRSLYKLGARKFVVHDVKALGCTPFNVAHYKPRNSKCVDYMNTIVHNYNEKLALKLRELQGTLGDSTFVLGKYYDFTFRLAQNPSLYGIRDAINPCCTVLRYGVCEPMKPPCPDRNSHAFFDSFHPTQATYKAFASRCFAGSGSCIPMNIRKLASL